MALPIYLFKATGGTAAHPFVELNLPHEYKILGGGPAHNWSEPGNLLTASYPKDIHTWYAAGKDHRESSPANLTAYAIALYDPEDQWSVHIQSETSDPAPHPHITAKLPPGFLLTGGGAFVDYGGGSGNLLTASFPSSDDSWEARSKDHINPDAAKITAYAIGIQPKRGNHARLHHVIVHRSGAIAPHPTARACLEDPALQLSGGGAIDNWNEPGNLLTASYPDGRCWVAAGKDHISPSPASITAYAIGIRA